jgi:methylase of polypeptide subunit release factors
MNLTRYANKLNDDDAPTEPGPALPREEKRERLLALLSFLDAEGYEFIAPTPATHARVIARPDRKEARTLVDALGWSLPVAPGLLEPELERALVEAEVLAARADGLLMPCLRVSRVEGSLFWHSAFPTDTRDSVFLGPDSCRFAQLILAEMPRDPRTILDYGAGAGVGGIVAARRCTNAQLIIADINPKALFLASINAEHAGVSHQLIESTRPSEIDGAFDLVVTHPPFMIDTDRRAYRDGGDLYGGQLSLEWALEGAALLAPAGWLVMHTGASIVRGKDVLLDALRSRLRTSELSLSYRELDPDIFGDELDNPCYIDVDRIAAVGAVIERAPT